MQKHQKIVFYILVFSYLYVIVRYHFFKGTDWAHFPVYVGNKAASMAGGLLLSLSFLYQHFTKERKGIYAYKKYFGLAGFGLVIFHWILSSAIFTPAYRAKFFLDASGKMNLTGELIYLSGVLGLMFLILPAVMSIPGMRKQLGVEKWLKQLSLGYYALGFSAIHVALVGYKSWFTPWDWHGYMPSPSFISFVALIVPILLKIFSKTAKNTITN